MQYRREIDGLRAVAVVPVILFHAGFEVFSGGFVGVDVFFVISGYLITTIIHEEIREGDFSLVRFYERRIRRILPALIVVSLTCIPFAWLWMLPSEFDRFSQSLVAVNIFASNFLFLRENGYFAAASELKPLLHTWSLAVEEQFYVLFPLFLLLTSRLGLKVSLGLLMVLAMFSLGLSEWGARSYPALNFYLLPTRAWELGAGAILAMGITERDGTAGWLGQVASAAGLGMVVSALFLFERFLPTPSFWALVPVIGTALILVFARQDTLVGKLLGWKPVVCSRSRASGCGTGFRIGLISR
jgi:peptidoglycan/LPS O-acetylase OafA/YrhL